VVVIVVVSFVAAVRVVVRHGWKDGQGGFELGETFVRCLSRARALGPVGARFDGYGSSGMQYNRYMDTLARLASPAPTRTSARGALLPSPFSCPSTACSSILIVRFRIHLALVKPPSSGATGGTLANRSSGGGLPAWTGRAVPCTPLRKTGRDVEWSMAVDRRNETGVCYRSVSLKKKSREPRPNAYLLPFHTG
jgi:hypothetical protein